MLRTWTYAPWKPIVGMLLAGFAFVVGAALVFFAVIAVADAFKPGSYVDNVMASSTLEKVGPAELLGLNLGIASLTLVTWFLMRVLHGMRPRWLASVVPRMRWRFFALCLGFAVVAVVAQVVVGALLPSSAGEISGSLTAVTRSTVISGVVILLTTPLQAIGEEYLFRGYLLQAVGSLFGSRWIAIVATATMFALAHGAQNFPLFFDRFAFGLIAGWLVTATGGLEAGIALHIVNNFFALGLALAFGDISETLNTSSASWWNIVLTVTQSVVYAGLVYAAARRMRLQTHTAPPSWEPGAAPSADLATA
ncbi:CPBP family intramembrane metalloprotease [Nocardioides panacis]|uniref:CPBP family intramembrane metalloprotease n=2 Tax=Nocardioides panacis TaxID=2849501 RepID=A0A975T2X1_9ACTN|nr:CPBP family intramembrane metalloprotease [Nocardioides panacis]